MGGVTLYNGKTSVRLVLHNVQRVYANGESLGRRPQSLAVGVHARSGLVHNPMIQPRIDVLTRTLKIVLIPRSEKSNHMTERVNGQSMQH